MSITCKNGVEWFVSKRGVGYTYVCDEHLSPAIKKYAPDALVNKVIGWTDCYWKTSGEPGEYWNLDTLARRVSELERKIRNCK